MSVDPDEIEEACTDKRQLEMALSLHKGRTLESVGDQWSLSRERVRQIVSPILDSLPERALTCSVGDCSQEATSRLRPPLCGIHYYRLRTTGTTKPGPKARGPYEWRFWRKVKKRGPDECWNWTGALAPAGYGIFNNDRVRYTAPQFLIKVIQGVKVPAGKQILHSCYNHTCVNPAHLYIGTPKENSQDIVDNGGWRAKLTEDEKTRLVQIFQERTGTIRDAAVQANKELGVTPGSAATLYYIYRGRY